MSGPPAGTLLDLLEPGWRRYLASGEPAGALDVEPEMLDAAAKALGELSRAEPLTVLSRRWPACVVVAVAQIAAHRDKNGKVWPAWHRAAGSRATKRSTAGWAEAFLGSLAALGLPGTAGDPREMVLAHAAVTVSSLPEFLRLVGAGAPEQELAGLDPAVAALLRLKAGARFVERCRALMTLLTENGEPSARDLAGLSLPRRIIDAARTVAFAHPGQGGGPPLRLDPFGQGVLTRDVDRGSDRSGDNAGPWTTICPDEAADPADPLLAFDADGERIGAVLAPEAVWLVYPKDRALRADTAPRVLVESRLPLTWSGWRLVLLDLSGTAWLELEPVGKDAPRRRPVRGRSKPRLVTGAPVPGIHTTEGVPVFGALPTVRLPAGEVRWRVEIRRSGSGHALAAVEASGDRWDPERLWDRAPRPVLGELVVTATAMDSACPGGRPSAHPGAHVTGLRRVVAVAEGLAVSYSPALRLTDEVGLEAAEVVLSTASGMTASPCAATVRAEVTVIEVACVAGPVVLPLRVTPPHCRIRIEPEPGSGDTPTDWHSLGPMPLETAALGRGGALRVDLPGATGYPPVDVVAADGIVQVLEPSRRGGYPLRRMLDTVSAHGGAELRITVGARTAVIARIDASSRAGDPWLSG
ncbi:MAG TPA: hypothetical protein VIV12_17340 [Streptosporangiaceae bacterium]